MSASTSSALQNDGLRERTVVTAIKEEIYCSTPSSEEEAEDDVDKEKKTFGRTPDGTGVFPMWSIGVRAVRSDS
jgi:hypothetical protein